MLVELATMAPNRKADVEELQHSLRVVLMTEEDVCVDGDTHSDEM